MPKFKIGDRVQFVDGYGRNNGTYRVVTDPRRPAPSGQMVVEYDSFNENGTRIGNFLKVEDGLELVDETPEAVPTSTPPSTDLTHLAEMLQALTYRDLVAFVDAINFNDAEIDEEDVLSAADRILGAG
jgi:hypothetical protein